MNGRYIVPKVPKNVRDEAREALTVAIDKVPDTIHFNQVRKRTRATLYVGNLEFTASTQDELKKEFQRIRVEYVVILRMYDRSHCYAFITLSWAKASKVDPSDIGTMCGCYMSSHDRYTSVSWTARTIMHNASSDDSVSSEYTNNMDQMIEDLKRQIDENEQQMKKYKQRHGSLPRYNRILPDWVPVQNEDSTMCAEDCPGPATQKGCLTARQELSRASPDISDTHDSNAACTRPQDCASARPARPVRHRRTRGIQ
jgi:hypothetical protein